MFVGAPQGFTVWVMSLMVAVVWVLAVARVTRLVNSDVVFDPVRLWVARRLSGLTRAVAEMEELRPLSVQAARLRKVQGRWNTLSYFIGCPWCVGLWVAVFTAWVPLWFSGNRVAVYVGVVLAASHVVGLGARLADDGEDIEIVEG
jgi:hypothetical protein